MFDRKTSDKIYRDRPENKTKQKLYMKTWQENKSKDPEWVKKEKERKRIQSLDYHNRKGREYAQKRKVTVLTHYSNGTPECLCCGEKHIEFLTADHIEGKGNKHRRENNIKGGLQFYRWVIKNNFPPGFRVLCMNCNFANSHFKDGCPHGNLKSTYGDICKRSVML